MIRLGVEGSPKPVLKWCAIAWSTYPQVPTFLEFVTCLFVESTLPHEPCLVHLVQMLARYLTSVLCIIGELDTCVYMLFIGTARSFGRPILSGSVSRCCWLTLETNCWTGRWLVGVSVPLLYICNVKDIFRVQYVLTTVLYVASLCLYLDASLVVHWQAEVQAWTRISLAFWIKPSLLSSIWDHD